MVSADSVALADSRTRAWKATSRPVWSNAYGEALAAVVGAFGEIAAKN
jgi:hypothetical protein